MTAIIPEALNEELPSHYDPNVSADVMEVTLLPSKSVPGFSGPIDLKRIRKWNEAALDEVLAIPNLVERMRELVTLNERMNKAGLAEATAAPPTTTEHTVTKESSGNMSLRSDLDAILDEEGDDFSEVISVSSAPSQEVAEEPVKTTPSKRTRRTSKKAAPKQDEASTEGGTLSQSDVVGLFDQLLGERLGLDFLKAKPAEPTKQVYFSVGEGGFLVNYHEVIIEKSFIVLIRDTRFRLAVQYTPKITIKPDSDLEFFEVTVDDESDQRLERKHVMKCAYGGHAFRLGCLDCFMLFLGE